MSANQPHPAPHGPLLPMRTALIIMLALISGAAAAGLLLLDGHTAVAAVCAGVLTTCGGMKFFHWLIA